MKNECVVGILGASGLRNVGDDLIANILDEFIKQKSPHVIVKILENPRKDEDIPGLDVLIIGGGGLIYDYDMANVDNYCSAIHQATNFRIPVYMMGIGVQHVFSDAAKQKYRDALKLVKAITTRGEKDTKFIREELGYQGVLINSRDIVFLYNDIFPAGNTKSKDTHERKSIALSLSDWKLGDNYEKIKHGLQQEYADYRDYLHKTLPLLKKHYDITIVCQAREDEGISQELSKLLKVPVIQFGTIEDSPGLITCYEQADLVISNRYHGFIAAVLARTPVIATSFSGHKTQRLINDSFPSLKEQYFEIDKLVKGDILGRLVDKGFFDSLRESTDLELKQCVALTRENGRIVKYITGEADRLS